MSRARGILLAASVALASSCTSIQWRGGDGVEHHLGLVAVKRIEGERGEEWRRYTVGIDVRLSGLEPGISVGWRGARSQCPEVVVVSGLEELGECVARDLETPLSQDEPGESSWRFFYYRDTSARAARTTIQKTRMLGIEVARKANDGHLLLGAAGSDHYVGPSLDEEMAQLLVSDPDHPERFRHTFWKVGDLRGAR